MARTMIAGVVFWPAFSAALFIAADWLRYGGF